MQVPRFSPGISLIEMAPRAAPHSGCPGRPALPLPCLSPAPQRTGSDWKNLPGTAQFLSTQTDTMFAFIYKMGGMLWLPVNNPVAPTKWLPWNLWSALHLTFYYFEIVVQCIILYLGNWNIEDTLFDYQKALYTLEIAMQFRQRFIPWQM
jgi:hypothetical protein